MIVEEEKEAGRYLEEKKKQGDTSKIVPKGGAMRGSKVFSGGGTRSRKQDGFLEPAMNALPDLAHQAVLLETTMSFPCRSTRYCSKGWGGGPAMFRPIRS
jgi:hypothetical protein